MCRARGSRGAAAVNKKNMNRPSCSHDTDVHTSTLGIRVAKSSSSGLGRGTLAKTSAMLLRHQNIKIRLQVCAKQSHLREADFLWRRSRGAGETTPPLIYIAKLPSWVVATVVQSPAFVHQFRRPLQAPGA